MAGFAAALWIISSLCAMVMVAEFAKIRRVLAIPEFLRI
jgi:hypothetical protein